MISDGLSAISDELSEKFSFKKNRTDTSIHISKLLLCETCTEADHRKCSIDYIMLIVLLKVKVVVPPEVGDTKPAGLRQPLLT